MASIEKRPKDAKTERLKEAGTEGQGAGTPPRLTAEFDGRRLLRFRAAGTACACDLTAVREIVRARAMARLPGAAPWVLGIMNVRGTLLTVVDLSVRLGAKSGSPPRFVMVAEGAGRRFGIAVESVQGVAEVAVDAVTPIDAAHASGGVVGGVVRLGDDGGTAQWCEIDAIARESLAV